jgi:hypothetical protein
MRLGTRNRSLQQDVDDSDKKTGVMGATQHVIREITRPWPRRHPVSNPMSDLVVCSLNSQTMMTRHSNVIHSNVVLLFKNYC